MLGGRCYGKACGALVLYFKGRPDERLVRTYELTCRNNNFVIGAAFTRGVIVCCYSILGSPRNERLVRTYELIPIYLFKEALRLPINSIIYMLCGWLVNTITSLLGRYYGKTCGALLLYFKGRPRNEREFVYLS